MLRVLASLGGLPEDYFLKPLPTVTLLEAERLYKDAPGNFYFFQRQNPKMPPLLFQEGNPYNVDPEPVEEQAPVEALPAEVVQLDLFKVAP